MDCALVIVAELVLAADRVIAGGSSCLSGAVMMLMLYVPQWKMRSDDVFCFELEEAQCTREVKVRGFVAVD